MEKINKRKTSFKLEKSNKKCKFLFKESKGMNAKDQAL